MHWQMFDEHGKAYIVDLELKRFSYYDAAGQLKHLLFTNPKSQSLILSLLRFASAAQKAVPPEVIPDTTD